MGFFDFFRSRKSMARVLISFPEDFEATSAVSILIEGQLPCGLETWVWDLYYAKTLFNLGNCDASNGLKTQVETWAEELAVVNTSELPPSADLLVIDPELALTAQVSSNAETYAIEVIGREGSWPLIQTKLPSRGFQNRAAYSVLALAQYFVHQDAQIAMELPLHVLAMRKYYSDVVPFTKLASLLGAPTQAVSTAMDFFSKAQQTAARDRVKKHSA